jgi:hypothetical protein
MDGKARTFESAIRGTGMSAPKMRQGADTRGGNTQNMWLKSPHSHKMNDSNQIYQPTSALTGVMQNVLNFNSGLITQAIDFMI